MENQSRRNFLRASIAGAAGMIFVPKLIKIYRSPSPRIFGLDYELATATGILKRNAEFKVRWGVTEADIRAHMVVPPEVVEEWTRKFKEQYEQMDLRDTPVAEY